MRPSLEGDVPAKEARADLDITVGGGPARHLSSSDAGRARSSDALPANPAKARLVNRCRDIKGSSIPASRRKEGFQEGKRKYRRAWKQEQCGFSP